jgi:hypothetical protein
MAATVRAQATNDRATVPVGLNLGANIDRDLSVVLFNT